MASAPILLAAPNVSEGRDAAAIDAIGAAFGPARLLDVHADPDHGRSVFTIAAAQGVMSQALLSGAREALARLDLGGHRGLHPHVGVLDVAPVVYTSPETRAAATAEALTAAALIGEELEVPVLLYGELATDERRRERADLRRGGPAELARRITGGELLPDYGPPRAHPTAGAVLVTARRPLVAFNLDLATDDVELARAVAAEIRESGGGGLPGVRAIGLYLPARGRAQVSTNVHDPAAVPLRAVLDAVRARAPVAEAELVGLAPLAALEGLPDDLVLRGFRPERQVIERVLG